MASPTDTLSPPPAPNRVYYSLGRMLGVEDFQAEQDYHRGRLARALLQMCGTGTISGLNVNIPQIWQANTGYGVFAAVFDTNQNVQVNTGASGSSAADAPAFAAAPAGTANDASGIVWTNEGQLSTNGWRPNSPFVAPLAIADANSNIQILTAPSPFTSGPIAPVWNTAIGATTLDGSPAIAAWTCAGPSQLEIEVSPGVALDRVGRMIEAPVTVCIRIQNWLANQTASDLSAALHAGNIVIDVFATFVPCTSGVTPCFATQDNYDATDAFSANRLLDSFAMQLVLRTDANPRLPQDPWIASGTAPAIPVNASTAQSVQQMILSGGAGPGSTAPFSSAGNPPVEYPPLFDTTSVFLARISIPATAGAGGQPPVYNLNQIAIDNFKRLFLYPASLVARAIGLSSGAES